MRNIFYLSPLFLSVIKLNIHRKQSPVLYNFSLLSCKWTLYWIYYFNIFQIPLGCVFIRYLILALSSPAAQGCFLSMSQPALLLVFMFWFSIFVLCKIAVGLGLIRYAGTCAVLFVLYWAGALCVCTYTSVLFNLFCLFTPHPFVHITAPSPTHPEASHLNLPFLRMWCVGAIHNEELRLRNLEQIKNSNATHRFETMISMNQLSNIERFTVYKGRVVGWTGRLHPVYWFGEIDRSHWGRPGQG
jgi:hypothetical protein